MTDQEIFDIGATHLLNQYERCSISKFDEHNARGCRYRFQGMMCGAGPFVKDDCPEGINFHQLNDVHYKYTFNNEQIRLIRDLQHCHDTNLPKLWRHVLKGIAEIHQLKMIPLTLREVFEISKDHLMEQQAKSLGSGGSCFYRGTDGKQCAAGPFVKDGCPEYQDFFNASDFWIEPFSPEHVNLILRLQRVHDYGPVESWPNRLMILYKETFNADYPGDISFIERAPVEAECGVSE